MQDILITFSSPLIIDIEIAKIDTSFLKIQSSF